MSQNRATLLRSLAVCVPLFLFVACAGLQQPVEVPASSGTQRDVSLMASSFEFRPNNLLAKVGDTLDLIVTNSSGMAHNVTVKAPDGKVLTSVDLPGNAVAHAKVFLAQPGIYEFYCDKPMHSSLGMKGRIEAR